jgi:hypothetical protein
MVIVEGVAVTPATSHGSKVTDPFMYPEGFSFVPHQVFMASMLPIDVT